MNRHATSWMTRTAATHGSPTRTLVTVSTTAVHLQSSPRDLEGASVRRLALKVNTDEVLRDRAGGSAIFYSDASIFNNLQVVRDYLCST